MTEPTYRIEADAAGEFLKLTLAGDWNAEITERFGRDVAATLARMLATGTRHGQLRTLIDMSRKNILPQAIAADFARILRPDSPSRKIALMLSGPLHRMQAKRLSDPRHRLFETEGEARAWLFAD